MFSDMFQWPEDRNELFDSDINEEEASFYFTLADFASTVKRYGADFVINRMDRETRNALFGIITKNKPVAALLKP